MSTFSLTDKTIVIFEPHSTLVVTVVDYELY